MQEKEKYSVNLKYWRTPHGSKLNYIIFEWYYELITPSGKAIRMDGHDRVWRVDIHYSMENLLLTKLKKQLEQIVIKSNDVIS